MNRYKCVGNLQEYAEPFVSLYYDYSDTSYRLFIRNNEFGNRIKSYLILSISIPQLVGYLNKEIGLNDIVNDTTPFVAEINRSGKELVHCKEVDKKHCYDVISGSELFDPEFCVNFTDILLYLNEKSNLDLNRIEL